MLNRALRRSHWSGTLTRDSGVESFPHVKYLYVFVRSLSSFSVTSRIASQYNDKLTTMYRIGVDVGGTNSDAAILDITAFDQPNRGVLASFKAATTPDITSGIERAVQNVLADSNVRKADVLSVTIGTTHFINALVEADARRLSKVAAVNSLAASRKSCQCL